MTETKSGIVLAYDMRFGSIPVNIAEQLGAIANTTPRARDENVGTAHVIQYPGSLIEELDGMARLTRLDSDPRDNRTRYGPVARSFMAALFGHVKEAGFSGDDLRGRRVDLILPGQRFTDAPYAVNTFTQQYSSTLPEIAVKSVWERIERSRTGASSAYFSLSRQTSPRSLRNGWRTVTGTDGTLDNTITDTISLDDNNVITRDFEMPVSVEVLDKIMRLRTEADEQYAEAKERWDNLPDDANDRLTEDGPSRANYDYIVGRLTGSFSFSDDPNWVARLN